MTATTARPVAPGDELHFLESGLTLDAGEPGLFLPRTVDVPRGTTVTLTAWMIENSRDRFGTSWLDLADDEDAQLAKWGRIMFRRGAWPTGEPIYRRGSVEALLERERRRLAAMQALVGDDLKQALNEIDRELGRPTTSVDLGEYVR
jgi:hypothetical protein